MADIITRVLNRWSVQVAKEAWSAETFSHALNAIRRYHCSSSNVEERLRRERTSHVGEVPREFVRLNVGAPWVWSERMAQFYQETDGFVYELVNWHHSEHRVRWRMLLAQAVSSGMDVLCLGDGIGYDSCEIGRGKPDARVTSFDYPGHSSAFAQKMIEDLRLSNVLQTTELPNRCFDTIVCLDVLEHVPDPPTLVRDIADRLAPGAKAYISDACWWVRPSHPTHLRSNLNYAGRVIRLFAKQGLAYRGDLNSTRIRVFQKGGRRAFLPRERFRTQMTGHTARHEFKRLYPAGTTDMVAFVASAKDYEPSDN